MKQSEKGGGKKAAECGSFLRQQPLRTLVLRLSTIIYATVMAFIHQVPIIDKDGRKMSDISWKYFLQK